MPGGLSKKTYEGLVTIANRPRLLVASTVGVLVISGLVYAVLEGRGPIQGVWWAIVTGFTVGYGDFYPETTAGRGVGAFLIISMFVLALCLGAQITARLVKDENAFTHAEQEEIKAELDRVCESHTRIEKKLDALIRHTLSKSIEENERNDVH